MSRGASCPANWIQESGGLEGRRRRNGYHSPVMHPLASLQTLAALPLLLAMIQTPPTQAPPAGQTGLTAVLGLKVGHHTLAERPTGCTVVLAEAGVVAGVDVRGSAPGTRETDLLQPVNLVDRVHAVVLSGGSAFGLDAASGVMRYLDERGVGYETAVARVPIVPAAILFDLAIGNPKIRPTADCGYRAARSATAGPVLEGNVGAGAGATVGKMGGSRPRDEGRDRHGLHRHAGRPGRRRARRRQCRRRRGRPGNRAGGGRGAHRRTAAVSRTSARCCATAPSSPVRGPARTPTIGVVATNARLTKTEATKVAQMAQDGVARAIVPCPHAVRRRHDLRPGHRHPREACRPADRGSPGRRRRGHGDPACGPRRQEHRGIPVGHGPGAVRRCHTALEPTFNAENRGAEGLPDAAWNVDHRCSVT